MSFFLIYKSACHFPLFYLSESEGREPARSWFEPQFSGGRKNAGRLGLENKVGVASSSHSDQPHGGSEKFFKDIKI